MLPKASVEVPCVRLLLGTVGVPLDSGAEPSDTLQDAPVPQSMQEASWREASRLQGQTFLEDLRVLGCFGGMEAVLPLTAAFQ